MLEEYILRILDSAGHFHVSGDSDGASMSENT
jgi:hypothetical protein